jgi:type II secretory pathway pseudopilin PulG
MTGSEAQLKKRPIADGGFTVVEIAIALSIVLIVTIAVIGVLTFASASETMSVRRQTAVDIANQRIELAKTLNYSDLGVVGGNPPGVIPSEETTGGYLVVTDVQRMWETVAGTQTASTYKNISVIVSWELPRPGSVTMQSAVFGRDSYANVADLIVNLVDGDDADASMENAIVTVDASLGAPQIQYADLSSTARFGRLPSGLTAVNVDLPPYIFDISPFQSLTLVPATLTNITITGWMASDVTFHVTDSAGTDVSGASIVFDTDQTQVTDSLGNTVFDGLLPNGLMGTPDNYAYAVTVPGYDVVLGEVPAISTGNSHVTVDVVLPSITVGRLTMKVYSTQTGQPLQGATVTCSKPTLRSATSDADGLASFDVTGTVSIPGAVITPTLSGYTGSAITTTLVPGEFRNGTLPMTPITTASLRIYTQKSQGGTYVARGPYWIRITNTTTRRVLYRWVYPYTNATTGILVITVPAGYAYQCDAYAMRRSRWHHHGPDETPTSPWGYAPNQRTASKTSTVVGAGTTVDVYIRW